MPKQHSTSAVLEARRRFTAGVALPADALPTTILDSWKRCANLGLEQHQAPRVVPIPTAQMNQVRQHQERLLRYARPQVDALHADVAAAGSIVILTTPDGLLLESRGDADFADRAAKVALLPGAYWSEIYAGTNAIGTALVEGRSIEVRGPEHYFDPHRILNCAAAPIFSPRGEILGLLDVSGPSALMHMHAPGLVRMAVDQIEHRYFSEGFDGAEVVRLHDDPAVIGTAREGVLVFRNDRLVAANRYALAMLRQDWAMLDTLRFDEIFDEPLAMLADSGRVSLTSGNRLHGRLDRSERHLVTGIALPDDPLILDPALDAEANRLAKLISAGLPLLICGEAGVGKEVFARAVHARSDRAGRPMLSVRCGAIRDPGTLAHLLARADGGTLLLDEISELPRPAQERLTELLSDTRMPDVALCSTSRFDPVAAVEAGCLCPDLYYRLGHYSLRLPPLIQPDRRAETVWRVWRELAPEQATLAPQAREALSSYGWPGNMRQLVSVIRALATLVGPGGVILPRDLPDYIRPASRKAKGDTEPPVGDLNSITLDAMREALAACDGNVSRAARKLGVHRSTLYRRLFGTGSRETQPDLADGA